MTFRADLPYLTEAARLMQAGQRISCPADILEAVAEIYVHRLRTEPQPVYQRKPVANAG